MPRGRFSSFLVTDSVSNDELANSISSSQSLQVFNLISQYKNTIMALTTLFLSATKLAGIFMTISIAANAFSFSRYRKKHLRRFDSPIDESSDILADFNVNGEEENGFFFGLATAPAHVEDRLNDAWLQFAEENPCHKSETSDDPVEADVVMGVAADGGLHLAPLAREKPGKKKRALKVAMEAMIRGLQKFVEDEAEEEGKETASSEECHHNVAAWHNVPYPEERLKFWSDPDTEVNLVYLSDGNRLESSHATGASEWD